MSKEEIAMAKEECCRLGECTATYYLVNFIGEIEAARAERVALQSRNAALVRILSDSLGFVEDELETRKQSFLPDDGEDYARYIKAAEVLVAKITDAIEKAEAA